MGKITELRDFPHADDALVSKVLSPVRDDPRLILVFLLSSACLALSRQKTLPGIWNLPSERSIQVTSIKPPSSTEGKGKRMSAHVLQTLSLHADLKSKLIFHTNKLLQFILSNIYCE